MSSREQDAKFEVVGSVERGMELATRDADRRVVVFERSWGAVDRGRQRVECAGIASRVWVHHESARQVVGRFLTAA